jgi:hypothetical protein
MKNKFLIILIILSISHIAISEENDNDSKTNFYTLSVGFDLQMIKINNESYFDYYSYSDSEATILEILPIDDKVCKMVIAVPWNRAGNFQNYVLYIEKGDMLAIRTRSQIAVGIVNDYKYNALVFLGLAK